MKLFWECLGALEKSKIFLLFLMEGNEESRKL